MEYIKNFTDHLVQQSWQIAVLFLLVASGSFLLRNKSSHWRYLLWCVILAKCLLPPVMTFKVAVLPTTVGETDNIKQIADYQPRQSIGGANQQIESQIENRELNNQKPNLNIQTISNKQNPKKSRYAVMEYVKENFHIFIFAVWGVGAFAFLVVAGVKAFLLNRWLLRHRRLSGEDVSGEIEKLKNTVSSRFRSRIWVVEKITQPFVWGLWRGCAYLPAGSKNSADVIMHELAHIIRLDAFVNLLQIFAQAIFWFHPFVWVANNRIRAEREKSCDEIAIARLKVSPGSYSSAVVDVLVREYQARKALPSLAVAGPVKNIEERIRTVMAQGKKFYSRPTAAAVITVLILAAICVPTTIAITKAEPQRHEGTKEIATEEVKKIIATEDTEVKQTEKQQDDFKATLSNGITVELIGVCEHPSKGKRWWKPNGEPLGYEIETLDRSNYQYKDPGYEFVFKISLGFDQIKIGEIKDSTTGSNIDVLKPRGLFAGRRAHIKADTKKTDIKIGTVADKADWNTIAEHNGQGTTFRNVDGGKVIFSQANDTPDGLLITITDDLKNRNADRLIVIDKSGKENRAHLQTSLMVSGMRQQTFVIKEVNAKNAVNFKFQQIPYKWTTFKNVSLKPNFKTDVQVRTVEQGNSGTGEKLGLQTISDANLNLSIAIPADWQCYKEPDAGRYKFLWQLAPSSLKAEAVFIGTLTSDLAKTAKQIAVEDSAILKSYFDKYMVREDSWTDAFIAGLPTAKFTADYLFEAKQMVEYRTYILGESMVYWFVFRIEKGQFEANKPLFDSITNSFRLQNEPVGQDANRTGKIENVDVYVEDFDVSPYEAGGLYTVTAKIGNHGTAAAPSFSMNFSRGDPKGNLNLHGKSQSGSYGAGPIRPGEFFSEQSSPFALKEGLNELTVVLDTDNSIAETNELNNSAAMKVLLENGKIIEKPAVGSNISDKSEFYIVKFRPINRFNPQTAKELLDVFNSAVKGKVNTHHFRTKVEGGILAGYICCDNRAEQKAIALMLAGNDKIQFIDAESANEDKLAEHYASEQQSLNSAPNKTIFDNLFEIPDKIDAMARMLTLSEKDFIEGLRAFLTISSGKYPSALDSNTVIGELKNYLAEKEAKDQVNYAQMTEKDKRALKSQISDAFFASAYWTGRKGQNPVYYGDKITPYDKDKVLAHWQPSENKIAVVYGAI